MKLFNQNPQLIAKVFSQYVKALVMILMWTVVALTSIAGAYVIVRGLWMAVKYVLTAILGI